MTSCDDVSYPSAYLEAVRPENRLADPNTELTSICSPVFEGDQNRNLTRPTKNGDPSRLSQFVCNDDNEGIPAVNQERDTTDVVERIIIASGVDSIKTVPYRSIDGQISDDSTKSHPFSSGEHCPMTEGCDSVGSSDDGDEQRQTSFDLELQIGNFIPEISDDCHANLGLNNLILLNGKRDTDSNSLLVDIDANHKEISYLENGILEAYDNFDDTEYDLAFVDDFSNTLDLPVLLKHDLVSLQEGLFDRDELDIVLSDNAQEQQLLETRNRAREAAFTAELEQRGQHRSLYATYGDLSQLAIDSHENGTDDDEDELICRAHQLAALHSNSSTISTAHPSNSRALQSILLAGNEIHAYVGSDRRKHNQHAVLTKSRSLDDPFCDDSGISISPLNSTQRGVILAESSDDEQVVAEKGVDQVSNPSVSCKDTNEDIEANMATVEPDIKEENVEPKVEKNSESNVNGNTGNKMEEENENASESAEYKDIKCCDDAVIDESTPGSADNVDQCDEETNEEQQSVRIDINTQISNMDDKHQLLSNQLIEFADNKSIKENESFMKFLEELRSHLACSRFLMNDLVEINSNLERKNLEATQEVEEAQDRFREGDVNDFRDLQKELEQASRNCRIMQFKLRKAEKRLEEDTFGKGDGNGKSKPKTPDLPDGDPSKDKIRDLNQQLAVAKDVSVRLHQELEMIEDKRTKLEEDNQLYRKRLEDSDSTKQQLKRDLEKMRTEVEILRRKLKKEIDEETSDDIKKKIRRLTSSTTSEDEDGEYDMSRLINDLQNASEREKDLQNQLQLAEEEANSVRKTITSLELDKDAMEFELERFKMRFGTLDEPKRIDNDRGVSTEREAEMRLQLMVAEQEATVMRKKILELETKNEELENSRGKEKGLPQRGTPVGGEEAMDTSTPNDSLKQEIELLKKQNADLDLKLQKWREYEHVFPADENGNGNEDNEAIINLRKELLFHKNHSIEIEVKNHVLEAEVQILKKLSEIVASGSKGKGKATENKLRAQLSVMRTEVDNMRLQVGQLQVENERLTEKQLDIAPATDDDDMEMNDHRTCPPEACSELLKLQENVTELEEQLDELQLIVKSREMNEEKYEIEVQKVKEDMTKSNMVAASKESGLHERIQQLASDNEDLKLQVDLQKSQIAVNNAHIEKLKHSSSGQSDSAPDDVFTDKSHSSEVKLNFEKCLKERISHLEKQLQEERKRTRSSFDSKPDVVGETNGAVDQEDDRSPGGRDRERELLKFELNESSMLLEDMRKELEDERERRKLERAEFEKKLAEAAEDKKRIERKYIFEKESLELQRKMEGFNWKKEKTDLLRRMEEFKKKAIALQEKLNSQTGDTKQSSDELSKQMQDLQHIRKRLESQLAKIDTECWKYKDQAEKAIDVIQKLTVENEELQASRDILKQERTLLHNKVSTLQVEHREADLKIRKEREEWDIEKLQYLKQCNENNNADKFKYSQELERLKKERKNQEFQTSEMEIRIEELEKKVFDREQRITSVQETLRQMEEDWAAERRRLNENFEKELRLRAHENKIDMEEKELEVRCKIREISELKEKIKDYEKDSSIQLKLIQDLERMQQENEAKWNNERKELINQTRKTDTEKVKSRQAEVVCDGARKPSHGSKSRSVAWESERSKLLADIKSLTSTLSNKEESWKAERVKYLSDIKDLRLKLRTIEDISEQRNTELCTKLEAATEMSESLKANENSFKDERQRLMKQIEQKDNLIEEVNKTADTLRATLDSQREELDNAKIEILEKHQREEKLLRTEAAAHKFRLESETKLFREESKYLEDQMQYEIRQRAFYETTSLESKREVGSIKSQLEVLKVDLATTKADYEREALIAKRSKQLLEEIQREKREVHGQLTAETQRAEILQKHYVDDKAGWDIMRNELQSKIHRLEQQGKRKIKHEELEARLKAAWDKERIEHRRVISDLHNKTIELRRQVENSAVKWHRERAALQENFGRERKILEDDRQKAESRISELVRKYTVMEESYQRTSEMEARLLQERDLWTVERYDLQKRLQENITSRRLELSRIEALFAEMRRIRSGAGLKSPTTDCGSTVTSPMSVHQDLITNGTIVTTNTNETKVKNSASHARSKSVERAPSIGGANRQSKSMGRSYDKVSPSNYCIEISLRGNLSSKDRAARARSQPDVLDSMLREPMSSPFKSSSLGRPSSRSSDGQRCMRSRSTERPLADWVCKNEDIPRRRRNRPILTSPGRFTVKGMLRETDRKSPSLPMDDPRYLGGMMEDSFVRTVRKALEQNQSPSRTTPPLGRTRTRSSCRGQYSDSEITGGGGSDSDSERRFTDPENGYSRPSRTLERPSRFGSGSGLLGQDIRKRSITSPHGSSSPGLSPMRSESRLPSTPPSFLIPKKQSIGSSSGTMSPSQAAMCLIPGLLPKTKSQMQAREQERLNSPNTPTGNGFKSYIGRQSPRDDSRTSSPKSSQSSAHSSPHKVSGNVYTPQHQKTEPAQRTSSVTTSTRSETTTTVTSQSKTSVTTLPSKSKTKTDVRVKPVQRRTVPIASEEGFDSGSEKSPAPMQTTESPLTKYSKTTASSKSTAKSKLNVQLAPSLTSRFAKPLPANRRPPSRWLRQRTRDDVCSDSEITGGFSSRNRKNEKGFNSRNESRNVVEQFQYPVLNKDERALRLFYKQRHSCETQV